jgi:hypothetical protein
MKNLLTDTLGVRVGPGKRSSAHFRRHGGTVRVSGYRSGARRRARHARQRFDCTLAYLAMRHSQSNMTAVFHTPEFSYF